MRILLAYQWHVCLALVRPEDFLTLKLRLPIHEFLNFRNA